MNFMSLPLGIILLLTGLVFVLLAWGLPRLRRISRSRRAAGLSRRAAGGLPGHNHAVIIVQAGGRVEYVNAITRQWFSLKEEEIPSLELLARRIRPNEDFLRLCLSEGHAHLSVNGRPIEGISYPVPGPGSELLVTLFHPENTSVFNSQSDDGSDTAFNILTDFSRNVTFSPGLPATLQAILENLERLIPCDLLEINLRDPYAETLTAYRLGSGLKTEQRFEKGTPQSASGYTKLLVERRQPLFIPEVQVNSGITLDPGTEQSNTRSYIGLPLLIGADLIGTLEASLTGSEPYSRNHLDILNLVSGQVAAILRNATMLEAENQRTAELSGLANLVQVQGTARDERDLYVKLINAIAPLFDVETLGFLIFNENTRSLEAQVPFLGVPPQVVELYRVALPSESVVESQFLEQEVLTTENAAQDELWMTMGFQEYAQAASWRDSALVPLVSSGRPLGYMQVSNHRHPETAFSPEEIRLLKIVANQVGPIIDNVTLVQQTRQRAQRSEALRRIASLTSSSATTDEILRSSTQELAHLLQADLGAIFLMDETRGVLQLHEGSLFGLKAEAADPLARLFQEVTQFHFTVTGSRKPLFSDHLASDPTLFAVYQPIVTSLGMDSIIIVPLTVREHGLGELMLASRKGRAFSSFDVQVVTTAASQLAFIIEGAYLSSQTDADLRRRVDHLTAMTRITRDLNTTLDPKYLLQVVYDESLRTAQADCGSVLLFDSQAATGAERKVLLHLGEEPMPGLSALENRALEAGQPLVVADFAANGSQPAHEGVCSALLVPIAYQKKTAGLIHLHSSKLAAFDPVVVEMIEALAVQAAIALSNATRYQGQLQQSDLLERRAETYSDLFQTVSSVAADQPLEQILEALAQTIQESSPFQMVLISLIEPETMVQRRVAGVGMPAETLAMLKAHQQPWDSVSKLLRPEFKVGKGYFIPHDKRPVVPSDVQIVTLLPAVKNSVQNSWHPEDTLFYPLYEVQGKPIGLISLDAPRDGLQPDRLTLENLEVIADQAALIIQNTYRLSAFRDQVETLQTSLQRQEQLLSVSQNHLPTLLHKDLEQMLSIRNLEQRARRIRAGLEITETINRQIDGPSALQALGREMLTRLDMSVSVVAENTSEGPRLLHVLGNVPRGASPEALFGQHNPLRTCLQTGESLLVMNLDQDDMWRDAPLLTSLHAKAFLCLPIMIKEKPVAGILAISPEPLPALTEEDRQTYYQISRQASIILQNLSLLNETRRRLREVNLLLDFSRQLSGLNPESIVRSLLESALRVVTTAHAGVVLLYNEHEGRLVPSTAMGYADTDNLMGIVYLPGEALPGRVFIERKARRVEEVNFARDYNLPAELLMRYREATAGRLPISSLLVPIQTSERVLGVLVLDNFNTQGAFLAEDEALLLSLTQQVALSIENVRLVQNSQERAFQLQALTEVSATMTASLRSSDLVAGLLDSLHEVLSYDTAILWLREGKQMTVAAARGFPDNEQRLGLTVAISDSVLLEEMNSTSQAIVVGDVRTDARFPVLEEAERLSWMGVPLVTKGEVSGVIALEKTEAHYFSLEVTQLITTFASQVAVALDNSRLYEDSVRRAAELDERSQRLALLNRLSADLSSSLNEDELLGFAARELKEALDAKRISMVMFDRFEVPTLQVELPVSEKFQSHALPEAPIFSRLRESLGVFSTENVAEESDLKPLGKLLKGTASLLILPLTAGQNLRALAFVHMGKNYHFSAGDIDLARTISNETAVALESARLYQSTVTRAEQLTALNRASYEIGLTLDPEQIYAAIHRAAAELMPAESFVISLVDEQAGDIEGVYLMDPSGRAPNQHIPRETGLSGRVINSGEPLLIQDAEQVATLGGLTFGDGEPRSIVAVPITIAGKVIGMLSAQSYQANVYSQDEQQSLGTLANQAAVAIQNGRLFAETRRLAEELEQRVIERTAELAHEQRNTETLLRILTEASSTLDLDRALHRTLALLNDAIGAEQGSILMVNPEDDTIHYRSGYGYLTPNMTEGSRPTALKKGEGLAGWVIKNRESVRIDDVRKDNRWVKIPSNESSHRSVIATPLMVGEDVIGAIMVFHRQVDYFTAEHTNLVQAIGSQVAVAINNAQLYNLIRDQAERLGGMLRSQQIEASRQKAILEAVADGVLVTDPGNVINFVNLSAEAILGLKPGEINGLPITKFVGLFGQAAQTWMETIHSWSENPAGHQAGESYAEQLTLETGKVVLVHLAPVIWRSEFLGTVSIFRDITREVEVDRLKSEFVATVSHELRTPMTSIKGYVDILLMGAAGALNENQTHFLDIVRSNTNRLSILVNDLLDISRIEAGRVSLNMQSIDLREVVKEVLADVTRRSKDENKPMVLTIDSADDLPPINGDLERVRQILANIVDNAYHYTPENGKIDIRMKTVDGMVQVDVKDTGIGIDPGESERVFERFYRGEDPLVLATPGTGLGLAIVKQLVNMHKGRIWLTSKGKSGQGSTFSFTLPIWQAED
jgi:PAS domain S-box-containing protein